MRASSPAAIRVLSVRPGDGDVFREPWEAQAFAMAVALHERGLFSWSEWSTALAAQIERARAAGDRETGEKSYRHWLATLERLLADRGITDSRTLDRYADAWGRAAERTPHGRTIELQDQDFEA